jgi:hypothetical protein
MAVILKIAVFFDVAPCSQVDGYRDFEGGFSLFQIKAKAKDKFRTYKGYENVDALDLTLRRLF